MSSGDLARMLQEPDGSISHIHPPPSPYASLSASGSLSLSRELLLTLQDTRKHSSLYWVPRWPLPCPYTQASLSSPPIFLLTHPPCLAHLPCFHSSSGFGLPCTLSSPPLQWLRKPGSRPCDILHRVPLLLKQLDPPCCPKTYFPPPRMDPQRHMLPTLLCSVFTDSSPISMCFILGLLGYPTH